MVNELTYNTNAADEWKERHEASRPIVPALERSVDDIIRRLDLIRDAQKKAMDKDVDYGVIPGTGKKPTLLKPGAEKLCVLFQLDTQFIGREEQFGEHLSVYRTCTLYHQPTGIRLGSASAMCSTMESKYAYRKGERLCPSCGKASIIKPKARPGQAETWWCKSSKYGGDGCGENFAINDVRITDQQTGRIPNEDLADQYPTVVRMAEKRALVAAVRLVTAASAIFDEEIPDSSEHGPEDTAGSHPDPDPDAQLRFEAERAQGASEGPQTPPPQAKPTDLASKEQRAMLMRNAKSKLGSDATDWIAKQMALDKVQQREHITVAHIAKWTERLIAEPSLADDFDAKSEAPF